MWLPSLINFSYFDDFQNFKITKHVGNKTFFLFTELSKFVVLKHKFTVIQLMFIEFPTKNISHGLHIEWEWESNKFSTSFRSISYNFTENICLIIMRTVAFETSKKNETNFRFLLLLIV